jgi:hypothetical protein
MSVTRGSNRGFGRRAERERPGHDTLRSHEPAASEHMRGRGVGRGHDLLTLGSGVAVSEPGHYKWERQVVPTGRSTILGSTGISYDPSSGWSITGTPAIDAIDIPCVANVPGTVAARCIRR